MKMSDTRKSCCDSIPGVGCDVTVCKYHTTDDKCSAGHIRVENHSAQNKTETFCGTFDAKSSF